MINRRQLIQSFATALTASVFPKLLGSPKSTADGLIYGEAGGEKLTMDYYAPTGPPPHPIVIIIHGGGFVAGTSKNISEAYCAEFLAPAGYAVFSINYRLAPKFPYPAMVQDVQRSVRYLRHNAKKWHADPNRIALLGGSAGGYLSNMAGILNASGIKGAKDPVDRTSARVQAVVTLYGVSDFRNRPVNDHGQALLGPLIKEKGEAAALAEASPVMHITRDEPPFLLIHGDKDETVPFSQSTQLQAAMKAAGLPCDLIVIPNGLHATGRWHRIPGVPDWERQMTEWLNRVLRHNGPIGAGIRARMPDAQ